MTIDRVSGGFFVLLGLFVIWERRVLPLGTPGNPGPGYFPLLLSILLILLGIVIIILGSKAASMASVKWAEARTAVAILACAVFATLGLERIGYRITMMVILLFLFGVVERLKIWQVFALTFSLALGTFWLFDSFLRVPLPRGGLGF